MGTRDQDHVRRAMVVLGLLIALAVCRAVLRVPSASMLPAVQPGDLLWLDRVAYTVRAPWSGAEGWRHASPQTGDVVVLRAPWDAGNWWVKRVVAVEGQRVRVHEGLVWVDGQPPQTVDLGERVVTVAGCEQTRSLATTESIDGGPPGVVLREDGIGSLWRETREQVVPPGQVFVVGDNRDHSLDSRRYGPVPVTAVEGRVLRVLASVDRCGEGAVWARWWLQL